MKDFLFGTLFSFILFLVLLMGFYSQIKSIGDSIADEILEQKVTQGFRDTNVTEFYHLPATTDKKGAYIYNAEKMWGDLTLFSSAGSNMVHLVDRNGSPVHTWNVSFKEKWPERAEILDKEDGLQHIIPQRVFLTPELNGDIIVIYAFEKGMIKFDKDSNVVWRSAEEVHHDLYFIDSNSLAALTQERKDQGHENLPMITGPYMEEYATIFDRRTGALQKRFPMLEGLYNSPAKEFMKTLHKRPLNHYLPEGDIIHSNTITVIPEHIIGKAPMLKKGRALISARNLDLLYTVNLENGAVEWATMGAWHGQHNPRFLENGNIVMFDNLGNFKAGGPSRVIEVELETGNIVWEYTGTPEQPLYSMFNAMVEPMPNGNIMVTESLTGRIFELTRDKEVVWEYYAPERVMFKSPLPAYFDENLERIPSLFSAKRYKREDLKFLSNTN